MAMPTSAAASAGASLTPSPAIATTRPCLRSRSTIVGLVLAAGLPPRRPRCRAWRATASAVVRLSPVSMTTRTPAAAQRPQRGRRRRLDRIGDGDHAGGLSVDRDEDRRSRRRGAAARPPPRSSSSRRQRSARKSAVADRHGAAVDRAATPLPASASKVRAPRQGQPLLLAPPRRSPPPAGVRSTAPGWRRGAARSSAAKPGAARNGDDARLAFGQRAGLVDDQRVDLLQPLQRLGVLDQHARLRAAPDADHDRHRRRQPERAGAGDDQHRHRGHQSVGEARLGTEQSPRRRRRGRRRRRPAARTSPTPDRRDAGSARGCAAPWPPSATICASTVSRPTRSARITKRARAD